MKLPRKPPNKLGDNIPSASEGDDYMMSKSE
eukprot:CAMPEP_0201994392 /NCGR_PEP_ID=MMETSP0905-20130828/2252_1 /ASSEMBLY_ACC=CAM_ASM_000554 /TAXON_ID=420261 /ORGANISM="Thalassiosira antarctica, Strain CCMP982" /LENGTH=30 /DNA_ID= /DNA_START= /DNA_END= /DNA_ORIENTATION=